MQTTHIPAQRLEAVALFDRGADVIDVAISVGIGETTANRWRQAYYTGGLDALKLKPHPGARPRLTVEQVADITQAMRGKALTLARIGEYIRRQYGVSYSRARLCQLSQAHGWQAATPPPQ